MKTSLIRAASGAVILALAGLAPSIGAADTFDDLPAPALRVFYGDLNLQDATDVARLHERIARAARSVCWGGQLVSTLEVTQARRECRAKAASEALTLAQNAPNRRVAQGERYASP